MVWFCPRGGSICK